MLKQILEFIKSVRSEWFKIVWPSREMTVRATIMIFVFGGMISLFLFGIDSILNWLTGLIY